MTEFLLGFLLGAFAALIAVRIYVLKDGPIGESLRRFFFLDKS